MKRSKYTDTQLPAEAMPPLQLEEEVRWTRSFGIAAATAAGRREQQIERLVADLSLDKTMLQDELSKKL